MRRILEVLKGEKKLEQDIMSISGDEMNFPRLCRSHPLCITFLLKMTSNGFCKLGEVGVMP